MTTRDTSTLVRQQYEALPYPPRDPNDENKSIWLTEYDYLGMVNHYCFAGRLDLRKPFRALVAGGGTGDATIFLAEQLRGYGNAEVVYLDLSQASMEIAQRRAAVRGLENIVWIRGSILDQTPERLGMFDYITSSGVLHHLENPTEGLSVLSRCLRDGGAMGIMVYGTYGRTSVYHTQALLKLLHAGDVPMEEQIRNARAIINSLPDTNWLRCGSVSLPNADSLSDSDLFDLFLHPQDRSYTVPEAHQWMDDCGLKLISFVSNKHLYDPKTFIHDPALLSRIAGMPRKSQQAIAEVITGNLNKHVFYASKRDGTMATPSNESLVPYLCNGVMNPALQVQFHEILKNRRPGEVLEFSIPNIDCRVNIPAGRHTAATMKHMDGQASTKKIMKLVKKDTPNNGGAVDSAQLSRDFESLYGALSRHNLIFLRAENTPGFKTYDELQRPMHAH